MQDLIEQTPNSAIEYEGPHLVFDREVLEKSYSLFSDMGTVYFPLKTNNLQTTIQTLIDLGSKFELNFSNHFEFVLENNIPPENVCFLVPAVNQEIIMPALRYGVSKFIVDYKEDLQIILDKQDKFDIDFILIRLSLDELIDAERVSKIGCLMQEAVSLLSMIPDNIRSGIAFHIPSKFYSSEDSRVSFENVVDTVIENIPPSKVDIIDIGGGMEFLSEPSFNDSLRKLKEKFLVSKKDLLLEPGTAMVDQAYSLTAKVENVRRHRDGSQTVLADFKVIDGFIDAAMHSKSWKVTTDKAGKLIKSFLHHGDDFDSMAIQTELPDTIGRGDFITVNNVGAYLMGVGSSSMAFHTIPYPINNKDNYID